MFYRLALLKVKKYDSLVIDIEQISLYYSQELLYVSHVDASL